LSKSAVAEPLPGFVTELHVFDDFTAKLRDTGEPELFLNEDILFPFCDMSNRMVERDRAFNCNCMADLRELVV
jgi:hypothetical protein